MTKECITLKDYLGLITDEDVRIELEIDTEEEEYYSYESFWLSDFRVGFHSEYSEWKVKQVSFIPEMDNSAEILIQIKP